MVFSFSLSHLLTLSLCSAAAPASRPASSRPATGTRPAGQAAAMVLTDAQLRQREIAKAILAHDVIENMTLAQVRESLKPAQETRLDEGRFEWKKYSARLAAGRRPSSARPAPARDGRNPQLQTHVNQILRRRVEAEVIEGHIIAVLADESFDEDGTPVERSVAVARINPAKAGGDRAKKYPDLYYLQMAQSKEGILKFMFDKPKVIQIVEEGEMIVTFPIGQGQSGTLWVSGYPTSHLVDNARVDFKSTPFRVAGRKRYQTVYGENLTLWHIEKIK